MTSRETRTKGLFALGCLFVPAQVIFRVLFASVPFFVSTVISAALGMLLIFTTRSQSPTSTPMRVLLALLFPFLVVFVGPIVQSKIATSILLEHIFAGIVGGGGLGIFLGAIFFLNREM